MTLITLEQWQHSTELRTATHRFYTRCSRFAGSLVLLMATVRSTVASPLPRRVSHSCCYIHVLAEARRCQSLAWRC